MRYGKLCVGENAVEVSRVALAPGFLLGTAQRDRTKNPGANATRLTSTECPRNMLDDAMAYCPDIKSIVYHSASGRQMWIMDVGTGQFRKAKQSPPQRGAAGSTIFYDPTQKRMLIVGGGPLEGQFNQAKKPVFRELYAFDPKSETVTKLADCPIPCTHPNPQSPGNRSLRSGCCLSLLVQR